MSRCGRSSGFLGFAAATRTIAAPVPAERYVSSRDGTRIGYLKQGTGPGLVLVQGAMADARAFAELAAHLGSEFTVYAVDRRGRGLSPKPYDATHEIARDVEDIDAVLAATGAGFVFGLSSGAVITLEAARTLDRVTKAVVFEPPFYADGISRPGIRRLNEAIERGDLGAALVDALMTAETAPRALGLLPRPASRLLARAVIAVDARRRTPHATLRDLLPGVRYDFNVVGGVDGRMETFRSVHQPVLLLSGTRSPAFLGRAVRDLGRVLPNARHVELGGLGHNGPWNRQLGGRPHVVAQAVQSFLVPAP